MSDVVSDVTKEMLLATYNYIQLLQEEQRGLEYYLSLGLMPLDRTELLYELDKLKKTLKSQYEYAKSLCDKLGVEVCDGLRYE